METAANTLKRVHLELGGKAPVIVFDDADVELVAAKASLAATFNTGQDCTAATRVYVDSGPPASRCRKRWSRRCAGVKVGAPVRRRRPDGAAHLASAQRERVMGFLERARAGGADDPHRRGSARRHRTRLLRRADRDRRRRPEVRDHPERGLWPGADDQRLRGRGRGGAPAATTCSTGWRPRSSPRTSVGRCAWRASWSSARSGSTTTSRWPPRRRTAASSSPALARTFRLGGGRRLPDHQST